MWSAVAFRATMPAHRFTHEEPIMKLQARATPDAPPKSAAIVTGPNGSHLLLIDGSEHGVHDRRLRDLEVVAATEREREMLRRQGYRILGL